MNLISLSLSQAHTQTRGHIKFWRVFTNCKLVVKEITRVMAAVTEFAVTMALIIITTVRERGMDRVFCFVFI